MSEPLGADSAPDHVPQETSGEAACPPRVAVIVPCFNEREGIARTIEELHQALAAWGPYELIVVDDASIDGSRELLREIAGHDPRVSLVEHAWTAATARPSRRVLRPHMGSGSASWMPMGPTHPSTSLPFAAWPCNRMPTS